LRYQPIYILTEDLNFFYTLKNELDKHNIQFQILNLDAKIPTISSIILTTSEDIDKLKVGINDNFLVYSENQDFKKYLIRAIAASRIGYKKYYSRLTFSIDPGKRLGLMIFLDDFYLNSYCCFEISEIITIIQQYIETFQKDSQDTLFVDFKLGGGVLPITFQLVKQIYRIYGSKKNLKVFLIDEFKSSKIRSSENHAGRKFSKDEVSALILAFRNGILVNNNNFELIIEQIKTKKLNIGKLKGLKSNNDDAMISDLKEIIEKVLNNELSLNNAIKMLYHPES
jgi:hypothetical protein